MRAGAAKRRGGRAVLTLLIGLFVGGWVGGGLVWVFNRSKLAAPGTVADVSLTEADELKFVPADAAGFAHVRLADLWKTEAMAEFRKVVEKAGPDALKTLDEGFVPSPAAVDRLTLVVLKGAPPAAPKKGRFDDPHPDDAPDFGPGGTDGFLIVAFSAPFDADKLRTANLPKAEKKTAGGKDYWQQDKLAVHFPTDKTLVIGTPRAVSTFLTAAPKADGPLAPALKLAAGGTRHLVAAVNLSQVPLPPDALRDIPPEAAPLLRAETVTVGLVLGNGTKFDLRAAYKDEDAATKAEAALKALAAKGRKALGEYKTKAQEALNGKAGGPKPRSIEELPEAVGGLFGLGAVAMLDEWLADPPLKRDGAELSAAVTVPSGAGMSMQVNAIAVGLLLPAVQKVREAAGRATDQNNLKQLGISMHAYHDAYGRFPPPAWGTKVDDNGKRSGNLSWRVAILPYIEQQALFNRFKHDEPWDSEANKKLIPLMPKTFANPQAPTEPGKTYYKVFVGGGALFDAAARDGPHFADITDGSSNTFLIGEGGDPVIWTKPDDFVYDPKKPLPKLGVPGTDIVNVAFADGSVRAFNVKTTPEETFRGCITKAAGDLPDGFK